MKRFHHQLLVLCALVLMFALAASLSPAAYAEYPHMRGNKGLKADREATQPAAAPAAETPVDIPDDHEIIAPDGPDCFTEPEAEKPDSIADPADDGPDGLMDPADTEQEDISALSEEEPDPDAGYDNNLDDLDIEEILRANTYENVMKNHSAFTVKTVTNPDIEGYGRDGFYCGTDRYNYYEYDTEAETNGIAAILVTEQNSYRLIRFADGETGFYVEWIADPMRADEMNKLAESCMSLDAEAFLREIIIDVQESGEGTLVITTADDTSALIQSAVQLPEDWENGIILRTYELDSETLEIRSLAEVLMTVEDEKIPLLVQTVGYQEEQQDSLQLMLEKAGSYEEGRFEDPCEISVIYDPGTEKESVCSITIEKGDSLIPVFLDGYELYENEAQEFLYMGVDGLDDMKIYAFPLTQDEPVPEPGPYSEDNAAEFPVDSVQPEEAVPGQGSDDEMPEPVLSPSTPADEELTDTVGPDEMFLFAAGPASPAEEAELSPEPEEMMMFASGPAGLADEKVIADNEAEEPVGMLPASSAKSDDPAAEEKESDENPADPVDMEEIMPDGIVSPNPAASEPGEPFSAEEDFMPVGPAAEEDFSALMKDLYLANKLDLIFLNHKSVEYFCTYDFEAAQGYTGYTYETPGMAYSEDADFAAYATDTVFYRLTMDERGTDLSYVFDFCNDYDPYLNAGYELVPENYEDWWDEEAESVLEYYEEDGILFLTTEKNEQKSREFVEDWLKADYDGEIVTAEITADAKSLEVLRYAYCVEKDGIASTPVVFEVNYDRPMPRTARMLCAFAERDTDWTADITVVMNPGTKDEVSQTMTVPIGSTIACATDVEVHKFADRGCTVPAEDWDGNSSRTFYLMPVTGLSARM